MQKIALITDSASDLSNEIIEKYNIYIAPFRIIYPDMEYEDLITIQPDEVYSKMPAQIPTTSLPSIERIENILNTIESKGYTHVISINISCNLSGTSNSIRLALDNHPNLTSFVFDTKTLSMGQGSIIIEAAKMIECGESFENIVAELPNLRKKVNVYFTLGTLEYLKKGGRIGHVAGTIGELLNLKPLIVVSDEGIYETYAKLRGRKQSIKKLNQILEEHLAKTKCNLWIINGNANDEANELLNKYKVHPMINTIQTQILGPALGVHTGPGLIGFVIQEV